MPLSQKSIGHCQREFKIDGEKKPLAADFYGTLKEKMTIESKEQAEKIIEEIKKSKSEISDIKTSGRTKKSPLPFTTSTLQQEAAKTLNFATQKTMRVAQGLYEGTAIKGRGTIGLITYLRTDSTRISDEAKQSAADFIRESYGGDILNQNEKAGKSQKKDTGCT